ncbi:hypothetical protein RV18_GL002357 [Enterococcus termitis]|nr:hypothetical protein RV18_GL002357 [Enterococcus termitis]
MVLFFLKLFIGKKITRVSLMEICANTTKCSTAIGLFFVGLSVISGFSYNATSKKELKADFKEHLSIVWKEESKEELYSLGTETSQKTSGELVFFIGRISTDSETDYRYVVSTEQGYQLRTLSKQVDNFSEKNVYVKESNDDKPFLMIEKQSYEDERFNSIFGEYFLFSGSTFKDRYTFTVPVGTVKTEFNYN